MFKLVFRTQLGGNVSIIYGLKRDPITASPHAMRPSDQRDGLCVPFIQAGETDIMITGGDRSAVTRWRWPDFKALIKRCRHATTTRSAPVVPLTWTAMDSSAAEGASILVFEDIGMPERGGADILAEILGFGCTADAGHITAPDARGPVRRTMCSLADAKDDAGDDYINAHGTSTPQGDKAERRRSRRSLAKPPRKWRSAAPKSSLGHSLGGRWRCSDLQSASSDSRWCHSADDQLGNPDPN
ncbi:MAG: hypothetical protein R3C05_24875 [Pirellulaceae bacterium]